MAPAAQNNYQKRAVNGFEKFDVRKEKFLMLLAQHVDHFKRAIIINRRQRLQRLRSRKKRIRMFIMQAIMKLEAQVLESVPWISMLRYDRGHAQSNEHYLDGTGEKNGILVKSSKEARRTLRFYEDVAAAYTDEKWLETFRMSKSTFRALCTQLRDAMQPNGINAPLKNLISLETRCALALYAFATGADYSAIATLFQISRTSVCKFMKRFAEAVLEKLGSHLLTMPKDEEEYREIRESFRYSSHMPPLCVGLLGVCEIIVSPHMVEVETYANDAGATTIVMQAIVDDRMLFRKVQMETKRPTMLLEAPNEITKLGVRQINERFVPCFVVAPSDYYVLQPWMMQRYAEPQAPHEHDFNDSIDALQAKKAEAFSRLFARWKILQRKWDLEPRTMISIASACCALHNLLEECDGSYNSAWAEGVDLTRFDALSHCKGVEQATNQTPTASTEANDIRDFLARTISSTEI